MYGDKEVAERMRKGNGRGGGDASDGVNEEGMKTEDAQTTVMKNTCEDL